MTTKAQTSKKIKPRSNAENSNTPMISFKDYNRILNGLEPVSIQLTSSECKTGEEIRSSPVAVTIKYTPSLIETSNEMVAIKTKYEFLAINKESSNAIAEIAVEYTVKLVSKEKFTEDFFEVYKNNSLPINIWPYFREYIQSTLNRMGLPAFTLPFLVRSGNISTVSDT
ncbi:hypothetical protein KKG05_01365 [bacterium]|nr:hypothetical protein [bacterium]